MGTKEHIQALKEKRNLIKKAIQSESSRPYPDLVRIGLLKKQKLKFKDLINQNVAAVNS